MLLRSQGNANLAGTVPPFGKSACRPARPQEVSALESDHEDLERLSGRPHSR